MSNKLEPREIMYQLPSSFFSIIPLLIKATALYLVWLSVKISSYRYSGFCLDATIMHVYRSECLSLFNIFIIWLFCFACKEWRYAKKRADFGMVLKIRGSLLCGDLFLFTFVTLNVVH